MNPVVRVFHFGIFGSTNAVLIESKHISIAHVTADRESVWGDGVRDLSVCAL